MSSIFRARRGDEGGTGGKILQQRRHGTRAPSPYQRPQPSPPQEQSPNWIFRASRVIANGAGKLVSSIFGSNDSDSEIDSTSEEDDDDISLEVDESTQIGITPDANKNHANGSEPFTQKSEVKLAIERLLRQETFSRDECNNLTKILKSRVVDCPVLKEGEDAAQKGIAPPEEVRSLGLGRKPHGISPHWESSLKSVPLGSSVTQTPRHDICNAAVMEAKKWFEEKRLESSSSSGRDHGICTLNTAALLPVTEDADSSPVDMAKLYMQVRPVWASPSLNYTGFRTPPPIRTHLYKDEGPYTISSNTPSSSKVLKRSSLAAGTGNSVDETRRVRVKSTEDILGTPLFKPIDSSARMSEHRIFQTPSATDGKQVETEKSLDESVKLPAVLAVNDGSPDDIFSLPCEKSIEGNLLLTGVLDTETQSNASMRVLSVLEQTMNTINLRPEAAASSVPDNNHDFEVARLTKNHGEGSGSGSQISIIPDSMSLQHNGDLSVEVLDAEPKITLPSEIKHAFSSDVVKVVITNNMLTSCPETSSQVEETVLAKNSAQSSGLKEGHTVTDPRRQHGSDQLEKEGNVLTNGVTANGCASSPSSSAAGMDPSLQPTSEKPGNLFASSSSIGNTFVSCKLSSEAFDEIPNVDEADSVEGGSKNVSTIKDDLLLSERSNPSRNAAEKRVKGVGKRGRKVLSGQRGRGRGKWK